MTDIATITTVVTTRVLELGAVRLQEIKEDTGTTGTVKYVIFVGPGGPHDTRMNLALENFNDLKTLVNSV